MRGKHVVLGLSADRLDVVALDGSRPVGSRRLALGASTNLAEWAKSLEQVTSQLEAAGEELQVVGAPVRVLYRSPSQAVDLSSLNVRPTEASDAAILAAMETLAYGATDAVTEAVVVGRDARKEEKRTHVVVAIDQNDTATVIAQMVEDAGFKFVSATPVDAALLVRFVSDILKQPRGVRSWLYIGEHRSLFLVADSGTLIFGRLIGLGTETFIQTLTRPIRAGEESVELDIDQARELFHTRGWPARDDIIDEQRGIKGGQLIPMMQPVMQRLIVELGQSLRFGVSDIQRDKLTIKLTGPGSAIPGLVGLIDRELKVQVNGDESYASFDPARPESMGSQLMDAAANTRVLDRLNLQPATLAKRRGTSAFMRWVWAGAAAAMGMLVFDGMSLRGHLAELRTQVSSIEADSAGQDALRQTQDRLNASLGAKENLEARIEQDVGAQPDLGAMLIEFTHVTPESVRLTAIELSLRDGAYGGSLSGHAFIDPESNTHELESYIARLRESPLLGSAHPEDFQKSMIDDRPNQSFRLSFDCIVVPARALAEAARNGDLVE